MTLHPLQNQTSAFIFYNEFVITSYIGYIVTVKKKCNRESWQGQNMHDWIT